jgi:hypothetical protein
MDSDELEALLRAVQRAESEDERRESRLPHLVACVDDESGSTTFAGPYPSRAAAVRAAAHEARLEARAESRLRFEVAPVFPPRTPSADE